MAGDEGRFVRHEKQYAISDLFRPPHAKDGLVGGSIVQAYDSYQAVRSTNSDLNSAQTSAETTTKAGKAGSNIVNAIKFRSVEKQDLEHDSQITWYVVCFSIKQITERQEGGFHHLSTRFQREYHRGSSCLHAHLFENVL